MDDARRAEIRARLAAATPGPWEAAHRGFDVYETQSTFADLLAEVERLSGGPA